MESPPKFVLKPDPQGDRIRGVCGRGTVAACVLCVAC